MRMGTPLLGLAYFIVNVVFVAVGGVAALACGVGGRKMSTMDGDDDMFML